MFYVYKPHKDSGHPGLLFELCATFRMLLTKALEIDGADGLMEEAGMAHYLFEKADEAACKAYPDITRTTPLREPVAYPMWLPHGGYAMLVLYLFEGEQLLVVSDVRVTLPIHCEERIVE